MITPVVKIDNSTTDNKCRINVSKLVGKKQEVYDPIPNDDSTTKKSRPRKSESITMTTIPVYYLEPNARVFVYDPNSGIEGEYIISRLTIPLQYNGTMQITATKAVDRIL